VEVRAGGDGDDGDGDDGGHDNDVMVVDFVETDMVL
jgi:hypothetical protein